MKYSIAFLAAATAVYASPMPRPQGVTQAIAPSAPAPSGCMTNYSGTFGIVAQNITAAGTKTVGQISDGQVQASTAAPPVSQISDGQIQASTGSSAAPITQISDGQIQATTMAVAPISQISDGQIQATTGSMKSMPAISQIADGQIQATYSKVVPVTQISDGQIQGPTATAAPVSQISDGQIQGPTATAAPVSQISDGQIQNPTATAAAVSQISDGQIQNPTATAVSQISDGQIQATGAAAPSGQPTPVMMACKGEGVLALTLDNGVLLDSQGRTGYIASNYQFQFDKPAQTGAIYTSGWSVCGNGSLALGGSTSFYQCLSGEFFNLYDRSWAAQCNEVTIDVLALMDCEA